MYCFNCGKEIDDDSEFCPFCGTHLTEETKSTKKTKTEKKQEKPKKEKKEVKKETATQTATPEIKTEPVKQEKPIKEKKPASKGAIALIFGIIGVAVAGVIVACVFLLGGKRINMLEHTILQFEGYNGYGDVVVLLDEDIINDPYDLLQKEVEIMSDEYYNVCALNAFSDKCQKLVEKSYYLDRALDTVSYSYVTDGDKAINRLSNGDVVTLKIDYDKEAFKKAGYTLTNTSKKFTVSGLPEPELIDVFQYIDLVWKSSYGGYYLESDVKEGSPISDITCEISEPDGSGNVTVTIDEDALASKGYKTLELSKTIYVGAIPQRIERLTDENYAQVAELAVRVLNDVYCNKCGSNLYGGNGAELIDYPTVDNIANLSVYYGTVSATFNITTEGKNQYRKYISFEGYIDSEGNYQCGTDFDLESLGCSISYGTWPEY